MLIPLARIGKLYLLKNYFKKIKISNGVLEELLGYDKPGANEIETAMQSWIKKESQAKNTEDIKNLSMAESISLADAELILIALQQSDSILSNDYRLHAVAKTKQVKTEWLTSFILNCIEKKILTKRQAKETMIELIRVGMRLSLELFAEFDKKIDQL